MNIHQAFLQAADQIEGHPRTFEFMAWGVPTNCGSHGCVLGWVGYFAGVQGDANTVAEALGFQNPAGRADLPFYRKLETLMTEDERLDWHCSPRLAAKFLRLYAGAFHSQEATHEVA